MCDLARTGGQDLSFCSSVWVFNKSHRFWHGLCPLGDHYLWEKKKKMKTNLEKPLHRHIYALYNFSLFLQWSMARGLFYFSLIPEKHQKCQKYVVAINCMSIILKTCILQCQKCKLRVLRLLWECALQTTNYWVIGQGPTCCTLKFFSMFYRKHVFYLMTAARLLKQPHSWKT